MTHPEATAALNAARIHCENATADLLAAHAIDWLRGE